MRQDALDKTEHDPHGTAARILDAAEEVFAEQGYAAASTREMARRAGVPFGAVHYHWGSKQHLWEGVFTRLMDRTRATVAENLHPGATDVETIERLVDVFFDLHVANPQFTRLAYRLVLEPAPRHLPGMRDVGRQLAEFGVGVLRERLPHATFDGAAAILVISNAFLGAIVDTESQEFLLGGTVRESAEARERLRKELRRIARVIFELGR